MASYKQVAKGNWKVTVSLGFDLYGKRKKIIKQGFRTKKEAEAYVTQVMDQKEKGYIASADSSILFKDYITTWYDEYKQYNIGINTSIPVIKRFELCRK